MQAWIHAHQQSLTLVLKKLRAAPFAQLVMAAVIGAALSLPAGLYMVLANLGNAAADLETDPQITLFMTLDANDAATKEIGSRLHRHADIREYHFVSRETAWHDLQERNGVQGTLNGLEKNPLPDAFIAHLSSSDPTTADALQKEFSAWPQVEHVQLDAAWVKRLYTLLKLGEKAVMILAVLLGFALIAIIGNTIRLQILTQREEIEVSKLIGATDRFIRRPFLYAGALQGVLGGITAWLILFVALTIFNQSVEELAQLYAADFHLHPLGLQASLILIASAALLGWLGSYWSVSRYLSKL